MTDATIATDRLLLRKPTASDVTPMMEVHQDPEVMRFLGPYPVTLTTAWRNVAMMVGHWEMLGYGSWVVMDRSTSEIVGRVGLWYPDGWPGVELGWTVKRSRWGQGIATEASRAALQWAWANLQVDHIISMIHPENVASIRIAEKLGESFERSEVLNGSEVLVYGIDRPQTRDRATLRNF
jgi:RimJ/RimL family protein N-acetyltransferase